MRSHMSDERNGDWYDDKRKNGAVYKVLRYIAANPDDGLRCVGKDDDARHLFEAKGGIHVPVERGARVIFFAPGEQNLEVGASVILEVPPHKLTDPTDDQLQYYVLGNYTYWAPKT
jgi:hypothetical protein